MTEQRGIVFGNRPKSDRLPGWASAGVVIIEWLRSRGLWAEASERLKVQREGGYAGIDAMLFLLYLFTSELRVGVKEFSEQAREHHHELAAVGERKRLPTQASMSRILAAVETARASEFGSWLLREAPGITPVLQHPSVQTLDALGDGWHVFDWDPTVTALRHRALPEFEGTPAARRRSVSLAAPGYPGRKRGEVQFSRATLQHSGSGLWFGVEMGPGNGSLRESFHSAVSQVIATCEHAELPAGRAILRADGAAGNVPFITACVEAGVRYITRLSHYQVLKDPQVVEHLNAAAWFDVPSSGSGPRRQAADLGRVVLEPAPSSVRADGSPYAPIETRVVVSRFPCAEDGRGAGVVIEGWQYELYSTDLLPEPWPEVEVVAGYYGRCGEENRFAQEDRELGLDRIFSYHPAGQQLATLIGLFVWNFSICRGMELEHPPVDRPQQPVALRTPVVEKPQLAVDPPAESGATNSSAADEAAPDNTKPSSATDAPASIAKVEAPRNASRTSSTGNTRADVIQALDAVDWERVLDKHDGWDWRAKEGGLRCPAEALLPLVRVEHTSGSPIRARFQADPGTCDLCERRPACIRSDDPHYRKDVRLPIPEPHAEAAREMWLEVDLPERPPSSTPRRRSRSSKSRKTSRTIWRVKPLSWKTPGRPPARTLFAVAPPMLLPAELRKINRRAARRIEVRVNIGLPPAQPKPSPVLALCAADRQRRRLSWEGRLRQGFRPE